MAKRKCSTDEDDMMERRSAPGVPIRPEGLGEEHARSNEPQTHATVLKQALLASRARKMLREQRTIVNNLARNLADLEREACSYEGRVRQLVYNDASHVAQRLRKDAEQAQMVATYHRKALVAAQESLLTGESRMAELEDETTEAITTCLRQSGLEVQRIDSGELQDRLFGPQISSEHPAQQTAIVQPPPTEQKDRTLSTEGVPDTGVEAGTEMERPDKPKKPYRSAAAKALRARFGEIRRRGGNPQPAAIEARRAAVEAYVDAHARLDDHRDNYSSIRDRHLAGEEPGLPDWSAGWTRTEFDIAHLAEWMRLSEAVREVYGLMRKMLALAGKAGVDPLPYQETDFFQPGSLQYSASEEQRMIDSALEGVILEWDDGIFENMDGLHAAVAQRDARAGTGYPVEWPMDEQIYQTGPELGPGDSVSCAALEYERDRNKKYAGPRPRGWTDAGNRKTQPDKDRHVLSHFF